MDSKIDQRDTDALLQIIRLGDKKFDEGQGIPVNEVFAELRRKKGIQP